MGLVQGLQFGVTIPDMIRRNAGVTGAEIEMLHGHGTITGKSTSMDTRFM